MEPTDHYYHDLSLNAASDCRLRSSSAARAFARSSGSRIILMRIKFMLCNCCSSEMRVSFDGRSIAVSVSFFSP